MPTLEYSIKKYANDFIKNLDFIDALEYYKLKDEENWVVIYTKINMYYITKYAEISAKLLTNLNHSYLEDLVDIINQYLDFLIKFSINDKRELVCFRELVEQTIEQILLHCLELGYTRESANELIQLILNGINN